MALGLLSHPSEEEEEERVWASCHPLPGWLLQGRVGIIPPCQMRMGTYLLTLWARHTTVSLQSKAEEGFREPFSLFITLPPPHTLPQRSSQFSPESHPRLLGCDSNPQAQTPPGLRDTRTGQCWSALAPSHLFAHLSQLAWCPTVSLV